MTESGHSVHFSFSTTSSRSQSPFPPDAWHGKVSPEDVYDRSLPWWRAAVRRKLVDSVKEESRIIARMQVRVRAIASRLYRSDQLLCLLEQNPYAMAGCILCIYLFTGHTHFLHDSLACLFLFWLWRSRSRVSFHAVEGHYSARTDPTERLLTVLAFGVYLASFLKDLICSPRPFAPPVTRLSM